MVKNIVKATIVSVVGLIAGINVFNAQKPTVLSDVAMANVEALASDETGTGRCSRAKVRVSCYRGNHWAGTRVKEIEYYDVELGSMLECTHVQVTECPEGSTEK